MNCRNCQYHLSQCLDGRLPSGRRTAAMQHVAECAACARFWDELQQAQQLVLRLPGHRVGPDFRENLWQRLQAGEGTPEAVFREPVPMWTKVRYVLTGAAAAAALLLVLRLVGESRTPTQPGGDPGVNATQVADAGERRGGLRPRDRTSEAVPSPMDGNILAAFEPLTPDLMAREAAVQFRNHLSSATFYAQRLQPRQSGGEQPQAAPGGEAELELVAERLVDRAAELERLGKVLLDLQDHRHVTFSARIEQDLRMVVAQIEARLGEAEGHARRTRDAFTAAGSIAEVLEEARGLEALPEQVMGKLVYTATELDGFLMRWSQQPEVFQRLFVCLPDGGSGWALELDPRERVNVFSVQQGECSPGLVAPRSRLKGTLQIRVQKGR